MLATTSTRTEEIASALHDADVSIARALDLLSRTDVQGETGLTAETFLTLEAGCTGADARMYAKAATALRTLPMTRAAFLAGKLSWGQVRQIVSAVRTVDLHGRTAIDALVDGHAGRADEPDTLVGLVDEEIARLRADLILAREDRAIERRFLWVQNRLEGGATFYGEADAESAATIIEAMDAASDAPVDADAAGAPSRAQQHMHALIRISESYLSGGHAGRPRPRVLATVEVNALDSEGRSRTARILHAMKGRPTRCSAVATETILCDATVVPVVFDGARPIAVGDSTCPIGPKLRTALAARDGGCRFPGCHAPVAWCDAHHIRSRLENGPTEVDNLLLLCRRCHRTVHRFRWRIRMRDDGIIEFNRQRQTYTSTPRAR